LTPFPKNVDFESAAFTTLGAIALHGFRLAEPQIGENVAVIGMGLLGLLTAQIGVAAGCNVLGIDIDSARITLASSLGLQAVRRAEAVDSATVFTANRGFDVVLICADTPSNDPVELAGVIARDRARVVATGAIGLTFPRKVYYEKEISFINSRSYGPGRYDLNYEEQGNDYPIGYVRWTEGRNFEAVIDLMAKGQLNVKPLITHRFPIEQATQAYDVITGKKKENFLGVLLTYPNRELKVESNIIHFPLSAAKAGSVKLGVLGAGMFANSVLLPAIKKAGDIELIGIASSGGLHAQHSGKKVWISICHRG
jgi:threonine dehydrogenase-like Zn-dependent dehydrogenase